MEKDQKDMISEIIEAFEKYAGHQAFVINNITYTYRQLSETVYKVSTLINNREDKIIGIIAEDTGSINQWKNVCHSASSLSQTQE